MAINRDAGERFMKGVRENSSAVLQLALQFEECQQGFEFEKAYLRRQIQDLTEKVERLKVVEENEKKFEDSVAERLSVLHEKEKESEVKQFLESDLMRLVLEMQNKEVFGLVQDSMVKKHEELMKEVGASKEKVALLSKSVDEKNSEFDLKRRVETERMRKEAEDVETSRKQLSLFNEIIKGKSIDLEKDKANFQMKENELNLHYEALEKKSIQLKKMEEEFQQKQKEEAKEIEEKKKSLEQKEKELDQRMKDLEMKKRELEERSVEAETRKRPRLEIGDSSSLEKKGIEAGSITLRGKRHKAIREHDEEKKNETELACVLYVETSSDHEAKGREVVCRDEEDPEPFEIPDTEFSSFSNTIDSFSAGQIWALYDPIDDMPRYYAQVRRVSKRKMSMNVTWLESVHNAPDQKLIPIACGRFTYGASETNTSLSMFSHQMNRDINGINVTINPKVGETWALFRDWKKEWNSDREKHEPPYQYDVVEILSEFQDVDGIGVAYLGRVKGFTSVYKKAAQHNLVERMISADEMFMFSHQVPSLKMTGNERDGVPAGSFELDPAALPRGLFGVPEEEVLLLC